MWLRMWLRKFRLILEQSLDRAPLNRGSYYALLPSFAWLLSGFYGLGVWFHQWLYQIGALKAYRPALPVICVGNITTGGSGKTPVTIALATYFLEKGQRVAVLSKGYRAKKTAQGHRADSPDYGDEPFLIQQRLPAVTVLVGSSRKQNLEKLTREGNTDVVIIDDGFQHHAVKAAVNLVLVDRHQGLGNGKLLPSGPLRDFPERLNQAHAVWLTGMQPLSGAAVLETPAITTLRHDYPELNHRLDSVSICTEGWISLEKWPSASSKENILPSEAFSGKSVALFTTFARPERMKTWLLQSGVDVQEHRLLPDHEPVSCDDTQWLKTMIQQEFPVLVSEKDAVKLLFLREDSALAGIIPMIWVLKIQAVLPIAALERCLSGSVCEVSA
ncbi:MAG: tetraacyldisaccharide 4'-kinase [Cyanobacteria bacterium]|nr:tetraacyldisaccharide 4'-kinase [Cyanobacteriota bacterium]